MEGFMGLAVMGVMLVLRLAVPVTITLIVAHFVRRLDAQWHPDASAVIAA